MAINQSTLSTTPVINRIDEIIEPRAMENVSMRHRANGGELEPQGGGNGNVVRPLRRATRRRPPEGPHGATVRRSVGRSVGQPVK